MHIGPCVAHGICAAAISNECVTKFGISVPAAAGILGVTIHAAGAASEGGSGARGSSLCSLPACAHNHGHGAAGRRQQSVGVRWDGAARLQGRLREARPHGEAAARLSEALVAHMDATNPQTLGQEAKPLETSPPGLRPTYLPTVVPGPASSKATYLPQEVRTD